MTADDGLGAQRLDEERAACSAEEWIDRCLDDGTVLRFGRGSGGTGEPEEEWLDWLVPDREGNGYFVLTGMRASGDAIELVVFDE